MWLNYWSAKKLAKIESQFLKHKESARSYLPPIHAPCKCSASNTFHDILIKKFPKLKALDYAKILNQLQSTYQSSTYQNPSFLKHSVVVINLSVP